MFTKLAIAFIAASLVIAASGKVNLGADWDKAVEGKSMRKA